MSFTVSQSRYRLTVLLGLANQLSVYLVGFLLIAVVTQNFGKAFFGCFAFYQTVFAHVLILSVMGFDKLLIYRASHRNEHGDGCLIGGVLMGQISRKSAMLFLVVAAVLIPAFLLNSKDPGQDAYWLAAFSVGTFAAVLHTLQAAFFQANETAEVPLAVSTAVNFAKVAGLLAIHATGAENPAWILVYVVAPPLTIALALHCLRTGFDEASDTSGIVRGDFAYSAKLMLTKLAHSGLEKTDLFMIGILLGATATAEYAVAGRLALIVPLGNVLLAPLFGPRIRYAIEQQQPDRVKREFNRACLFATAVGLGGRPLFFLGILLIIMGVQLVSIGLLGELMIQSRKTRGVVPQKQAEQTGAAAER